MKPVLAAWPDMRLALQGIALFAFIPLVLFLYLALPLGAGASLAVGLVLMFGHRFIAAPWMASHATERCLWCGRTVHERLSLEVTAGGQAREFSACTNEHREQLERFFTFLSRFRLWIALGIFVPLVLLLVGTLLHALGYRVVPQEWNALQFKMIVALTVTLTSVAYLAVREPAQRLACLFPLHNLFLLGVNNTLWVFRLVGIWWLVAGGLTLMRAFSPV